MSEGPARPRIGVVLPGDADAWTAAVAARTVVLMLLRRLPWARVAVLVDGADFAGMSSLDCGRPPRPLAADGPRLDVLVAIGGAAASDADAVRLPGTLLDVPQLAAHAQSGELRRNRLGTMRLLGWLPDADTPYSIADTPGAVGGTGGARVVVLPAEAGVDEVVAAIAGAAAYAGTDPLRAAIAAGARQDDDGAIESALDTAATEAVDRWRQHGSPGAIPDPAPARHAAAEQARLRVEIRRLEHELQALPLHVNHLETELRKVTSSRTWRYTESARGLYRAARRRLRD